MTSASSRRRACLRRGRSSAPECGQRDLAARLRQRRLVGDHFRADRRHLHLAEPCADLGGQARIGSNRREFRGLAGADPDAGIRHQAARWWRSRRRNAARCRAKDRPGQGRRGRGRCRCSRRAAPCDRQRRSRCRRSVRRCWRTRCRWCCRRRPWWCWPGKTPGTSAPASRCRAPAGNTGRRSCARKKPARSRPDATGRGGGGGLLVEAERIGKETGLRRGLRCCCCCFCGAAEQKIEQAFGGRHARRKRSGACEHDGGNKHHAAPHALIRQLCTQR